MQVELVKPQGSIFGGVLLITGSCIGAGLLGLPIVAGMSGFFPAIMLLVLAGLFMTITGLMLVEVQEEFDRPVNFITMVSFSLGKIGRLVCWIAYLFLFYSILVAYTALSGLHMKKLLSLLFALSIPEWLGGILFVMIFGGVVYRGTRSVDLLNRFLMLIKIIAFIGLIIFSSMTIQPYLYQHTSFGYMLSALPLLIISFGFHNVTPSLSQYLNCDAKRTKQAIIGGVIFVFCINVLWLFVAIGNIPLEGENGIFASFHKGIDAAQSLSNLLGSSTILISSSLLAFFAILTSFLAQSLTLVHFLKDGLHIQKKGDKESLPICLLVMLPPLLIAMLDPSLFFSALNFAGGICAVTIFGLFPALMVWKKRYFRHHQQGYYVKGGKPVLIFVLLFALFVFIYQLLQMVR